MTPDAISRLQRHVLSALQSPPEEARRLLHGRGRRWPGLEQVTVDWLEGVLLVSLYRAPGEADVQRLQAMLEGLAASPEWLRSGARSVLLQHRYRPDALIDCVAGEAVGGWCIHEGGLRYGLDLGHRQNIGLFLDIRNGRRWVRDHSAGRRVLNLFAYTCGFSVAAMAGGAEAVVNLDMSRAALSRGRDNHRLNEQDLSRVTFLDHDLFKSWGKLRKLGPYELIIIDPPTFQKGSFALDRDYAKVLRRLPELLQAGGHVLACVNDPGVEMAFLLHGMATEAPGLRFVERLDNPPEFADIDPDGGLKALVFSA